MKFLLLVWLISTQIGGAGGTEDPNDADLSNSGSGSGQGSPDTSGPSSPSLSNPIAVGPPGPDAGAAPPAYLQLTPEFGDSLEADGEPPAPWGKQMMCGRDGWPVQRDSRGNVVVTPGGAPPPGPVPPTPRPLRPLSNNSSILVVPGVRQMRK